MDNITVCALSAFVSYTTCTSLCVGNYTFEQNTGPMPLVSATVMLSVDTSGGAAVYLDAMQYDSELDHCILYYIYVLV